MPIGDIPGHPDARDALLRAVATGHLPHGLLFFGPRGVGKRDAAVALAQALLCPSAAPDACGRCNACRRTAAGIHPDLIFVERDGMYVKVEATRELVRESFLRPYEGRAKVFVLPAAEWLNDESANTLLKTLEEPPASTYLVLLTTSREAVLPTIRSRCQAIAFHPLPRADLARVLVERHGIPPAEADLRARLGAGNIALAAAIDLPEARAERDLALALLAPLAKGVLGPGEAERITATAEAVAKKEGVVDSFLLGTLRSVARDALLLAASGRQDLLFHVDAADALARLAQDLGTTGAAALLADLDEAETDLRTSANKKLLTEAVLTGVYLRARS
jgi:DNA polymerase-3 subunit delta'